jgi:hypothetical protein
MAKTKTAPKADFGLLSPLELTAVAQCGKAATKVREQLEVGPGQAVDVTVRIYGSLGVGDRSPYVKTTKPDLARLVGQLLHAAGPRKARELVQLALVGYRTQGDVSQEMQRLADELVDTLTEREPDSRNGNIAGSLKADVVARGPSS